MKLPRSLSYSSMSLLEKNPEEFYIRYLADMAAPRLPQEPPMAVGSSFDAHVKAALHAALFGVGADPKFALAVIFESQVESQCRDFALGAGQYAFECYQRCGAYADLLALLQKSIEPPRFEFKVDGTVGDVPFTGKPDCRFVLDLGEGRIQTILDWKVKGFCSKYGASPTPGYALCRDAYPEGVKASRSHGQEHNKYLGRPFRGLVINAGYMETCSTEYADQLCLYGWLLNETPGDENVVCCIEEIVSKYMGDQRPLLRVANHKGRVKSEYQLALVARVQACWQRITSGHLFPDLSREDSDARCQILDKTGAGLLSDGSVQDEFFNKVTRETRW